MLERQREEFRAARWEGLERKGQAEEERGAGEGPPGPGPPPPPPVAPPPVLGDRGDRGGDTDSDSENGSDSDNGIDRSAQDGSADGDGDDDGGARLLAHGERLGGLRQRLARPVTDSGSSWPETTGKAPATQEQKAQR
jgi:hypothetical protein